MNIRKSLFTTLAAFGLMVSIAAPAVLAADDNSGNDSTTATVDITAAPGVFDVRFCATTTPLTVTAQPNAAAGVAAGTLSLCYDDTKADRNKFTVSMSAGNFVDGSNSIPANLFRITRVYNVGQIQWGNLPAVHHVCDSHGHISGCTSTVPVPTGDVGDIGYVYDNGATTPQNITGGVAWTTNNTLDQSRKVGFGYEGVGTISSSANIDVALTIPGGTPDGHYTSNVTLSVAVGSMP